MVPVDLFTEDPKINLYKLLCECLFGNCRIIDASGGISSWSGVGYSGRQRSSFSFRTGAVIFEPLYPRYILEYITRKEPQHNHGIDQILIICWHSNRQQKPRKPTRLTMHCLTNRSHYDARKHVRTYYTCI